jgi:RNA polymerase sigma-70 factor, ECF subfamily
MTTKGAHPNELERLYRQRSQAFLRTITAFLGDGEAALDTVQEGFAQALHRRRNYRRDGPLEAWVWRIIFNLAHDRLRSEAKAGELVRMSEPTTGEITSDDDIRSILRTLPERQRLAVFLRYYADLPYEQIGEALGIRAGTVAASLNAAHTALRHEIKEVRR